MSELKRFDISTEAWREYYFNGRVYRVDSPVTLYFRDGGVTHRVVYIIESKICDLCGIPDHLCGDRY